MSSLGPDPLQAIVASLESIPSDGNTLRAAVNSRRLSEVILAVQQIRALSGRNEVTRLSSSICIAIENRDLDIVKYLVREGVVIEGTAIEAAVALGSRESLRFMFENGWHIDKPIRHGSTTALGFAIVKAPEMVEWLIDNGADPNAECYIDYTPLSVAVSESNIPMVSLLLACGGNAKKGQLMHRAACLPAVDASLLDMLFEAGAPLDEIEYEHHLSSLRWTSLFERGTPLHEACKHDNKEAVRWLLDRGADPWRRNTRGYTPDVVAREQAIKDRVTAAQVMRLHEW